MIKRLCSKVKCNFYRYNTHHKRNIPNNLNNGKCIYFSESDKVCIACCYLCNKNNKDCDVFLEDPFIYLTKRNFILRNIKRARNSKRNIGSGSKKKS